MFLPELMCECSRCTGVIVFPEQEKVVRCRFCQYPNQRPHATGGTLDKLKRGNRLLQQCRFEEAERCYQYVLLEYPDEPEALWGRLMCKYGVEVTEEKKYGTVHRYLLCHRARRSSIRNEGDFLDACEYADPIVREQYEKDAEYIDNVQQKIREAAERQESYDVFICYKETDLETGERTKDSMIAQQLYNRYTHDGYRVFFARETLCDKIGEDYEAAIYQAIATAKVMLVVGLKAEHYQAVWPKSEWMRYLEKMERGEGFLIPVYGEMKAEEMPAEFRNLHLQGCCIDTNFAYIDDIESKLYRVIRKPTPISRKPQDRQEESLWEGKTEVSHKEPQHQEVPAVVSDKPQEITYPDGKYVGQVVNGKRHGRGMFTWKNGAQYDGEWVDDKRNGKGVYTLADGGKYDGEWMDDKFNGTGILTQKDGGRYEGEWEKGLFNGKGVMYYSDEDKFNRVKYDGQWSGSTRTGKGVMTWKDGSKYDGEWKNGKFNGYGVYYKANGDRHEGEWVDDKLVTATPLRAELKKTVSPRLELPVPLSAQQTKEKAPDPVPSTPFPTQPTKAEAPDPLLLKAQELQRRTDNFDDLINAVKAEMESWRNGAPMPSCAPPIPSPVVSIKPQELTYPDGKYVGEIVNGKRHGKGVMYYSGGNKYDGEWKDDKRTGKGVFTTWPDGAKYDGEWKDDMYNGHGVFTSPDGLKYDGEWKDDMFNGHGVLYYSDLDDSDLDDSDLEKLKKYDGEWKDDKRNGHGVFTSPDGRKYDGEWKDDKHNGHGVMIWPDGKKYDGEWKDDRWNGKGVMYYSNGNKYDGEWKDGKRNGHGAMIWKDGAKYDGEWKDDERTGKGVYYYANGNRYEGEFYNGDFTGRGTLIERSGKRIPYKDGKRKWFF